LNNPYLPIDPDELKTDGYLTESASTTNKTDGFTPTSVNSADEIDANPEEENDQEMKDESCDINYDANA
jgi:hypothetical protein